MKICFNGTRQETVDGMTVAEFLTSQGFPPAGIVAEVNGEILGGEELGKTLAAGDVLNAFRIVSGG